MNLVKKPNSNNIVIFMEERDFNYPPDVMIKYLNEIIPIVTGFEVTIKLEEVNDIPISHFVILLSFFKSMKGKKTTSIIKCGKELLSGLLDAGIGNLVYSIEEI